MAAKLLVPEAEDEFIDIEITSSFNNFLLSHTSSSPNPSSSEFEFQMSSSSSSSSSSTSSADDLFYKGKLLPLHLPPRLQMVQQILQNEQNDSSPLSFGSVNGCVSNRSQSNNQKDYGFDEFYGTHLMTSYSTPITVTPFQSCNEEEEDDDEKNQKKMRKQQKKKHFSLVSKLRAWFGKVSCKYELAYVTKKVSDEGSASKARESNILNHKQNGKKLYPFGQIIQTSDRGRFRSFSSRIEFRSIDIDREPDRFKGDDNGSKRITRSSLVANKLCFNGSASFSGLPNKSYGSLCQELEIGNLIMGAIAHCKSSLSSSTSFSN
ncbi:hypothetical protein K1719_001156 [Acacia pycnantha]|nr:hypothetical protein K1719_001156 [Acacia pycnantha]